MVWQVLLGQGIVVRMAKRSQESSDYDSPWKEALHRYLQESLAFFFPAISRDIDWTRAAAGQEPL
jgi:hypothetical protein